MVGQGVKIKDKTSHKGNIYIIPSHAQGESHMMGGEESESQMG